MAEYDGLALEQRASGTQEVERALSDLADSRGDFEAVLSAVTAARFAVRPTATNQDTLFENIDYAPITATFDDTVMRAFFGKVITREQYDQLREAAQFVPDPSRA